MAMQRFDVIVVGGGLVGASFALALEKADVTVNPQSVSFADDPEQVVHTLLTEQRAHAAQERQVAAREDAEADHIRVLPERARVFPTRE